MKIAISGNRKDAGKIPQGDKAAWREFNGSFQNVDIEPKELAKLIATGFAYTPQHSGYRHSDNFIAAQHISLDFDTEDSRSTFGALLQDDFIRQYASFLHTTPSHTEEKPRARVVFVLDRPIGDKGKYAELAQSLVHKYQMADRACKDPARFFYGANGCNVQWIGNLLPLEVAASELVFPYRNWKTEQARIADEQAKSRVITTSENVPARILEKHSQSLLDRVSSAADGEKYVTLRDTAITFGGYVAGGYYSRLDVIGWLQNAIRANRGNVQDYSHADATIEESVAYGMNKPLFFEMRNQEPIPQPEIPELDSVHPPLSEQQRKQITAVIRSREWKAYHDGMTAAQRQEWRRHFPDYIVDMYQLGYCGDKLDNETGELEALNALTIPYRNLAGEIVNVEYRNSDVKYEIDQPTLFITDRDRAEYPAVIVPDSLTAITTYLHYGASELSILGLPDIALNDTSLDAIQNENITVLLEPLTTAKNLRALKNHARFVRLPLPLEKAIQYGMDKDGFGRILKQARRWE